MLSRANKTKKLKVKSHWALCETLGRHSSTPCLIYCQHSAAQKAKFSQLTVAFMQVVSCGITVQPSQLGCAVVIHQPGSRLLQFPSLLVKKLSGPAVGVAKHADCTFGEARRPRALLHKRHRDKWFAMSARRLTISPGCQSLTQRLCIPSCAARFFIAIYWLRQVCLGCSLGDS